MQKILAAMSGGVDSAVAAARLLEQGYAVAGATMVLHDAAAREAEDAERSCRALGIPFFAFPWQTEFAELVQRPFMRAYQAGKTPNPCVICNKFVKFGLFLDKALSLGYDAVATGHYARIERDASGRFLVRTALDASKDQTYMFHTLSQRQLAHIVLPMGTMTKAQAREKAAALGLAVAEKHDSQDVCFIPDGDYFAWLCAHGVQPQPGRFRGPDGADLGAHRGLEAYTIGQRRGLDIAYGSRIYVTGKSGTDVLLGPNEALFSDTVRIRDVNWIPFDRLTGPIRAEAKLRYSAQAAPCTVEPTQDGAMLRFDAPQRAATPGQAAVLYCGELLLGGGEIC